VLFLLPFLFLLVYTVFLVVPRLQQFFGSDGLGNEYLSALQTGQGAGLPEPIAELEFGDLVSMDTDEVASLLNDPAVQSWIDRTVSNILQSVDIVGGVALNAFIMLAGTYYLLTSGPRLVGWFLENFDDSGVVEEYTKKVDSELSSILFGNILNAVVTGIIGTYVFLIYNIFAPGAVKVPFPPLVGALTGVGSLIPIVGIKIVYLPVVGLLAVGALAAGEPGLFGFVALFFILTFVFVDVVPDFMIRPYVSGDHTHVGLLMFAYIFGPIAFGIYGIFLGPILLVLVSQFLRTVAPYVLSGGTNRQQTTFEEFGKHP
jgi:predicted PurR-regulated permease PerM